jgi:hypothetical protein
MNHERNKAQAAYLSVMERAPAHEGAPFSIKRALSEIAHRGRALSHEGAPFSIKRALSELTKPKLDTLLH